MTLGGLALAVGILVDDATVAIENINWHLAQGKDLEPAILDGAQQIAVPAFVSTLCICIVFVPMFFLTGVARYLFVPLAEAVVFAMLASYVLSRTLVPTMAKYLLHAHEAHGTGAPSRNPFVGRAARVRRAASCGCATATAALLERCVGSRGAVRRGVPRRVRRVARCWSAGSARTSSPPSTAASSSCTCARRPARASRRRRRSCDRVEDVDPRGHPARASSPASSTTSACPTAASTCRTATRRRSARRTPTSWCRSAEDHRPTADYVHDLRLTLADAISRRHVLVPPGRHRQRRS